MSTTEQLLPCPFCGGEPLVSRSELARNVYRVSCEICDASPSGRFGEKDAIAAWNRRATPPALVEAGAFDDSAEGDDSEDDIRELAEWDMPGGFP